ncbi:MAG: lysine--tRNA ligase [Solirubrobacterales bacterium]
MVDDPKTDAGAEGAPPPISELLAERRGKLDRLREQGVDPFPPEWPDRTLIAEVRVSHRDLEAGAETDSRYRLAGRLEGRRGHGKAAFLDLRDASGLLQLHARLDVLGEGAFALLTGLDLGDIVGVEGTAFSSRRGELSLKVDDVRVLAKTLRPPPDRHHGLADTETRSRHRELDLMANEDARERFLTRSRIVAGVRRWLDGRGFVEVETPVLQPLYGGALARPFTTHHNALDRDLYLRIATELYLKRCVVGGIERVYELGKDFRNEGISPKHNPEFTMVEWYEAYADYTDAAARLEQLVADVATDVLDGTTVDRTGPGGEAATIDLAPPWRRIDLREAIADATGIDIDDHPDRDALAAAISSAPGVDHQPADDEGWGKLVDALFSDHVEPTLIQPTFVRDYPVALSPFAKDHRERLGYVERWEAFAGGMEIANAFSELNDPDEQRRRFDAQRAEPARGDAEAQPHDEDFIMALEHGMPPTAGVGLGIDRLVVLLTDAPSIREVVLFPAMR